MALPASFLEELRLRTPLAPLIGQRVKLERAGRQWKACCPFHGEKTPSFYVYDDHYHCFGCGAHGDAIAFVMQSEGASFPEAAERLAADAGLDLPKPTPTAAEADRRRHSLHAVLAAATAWFQERLSLPEGRRAFDYLRHRGLSEETIRRFGVGWSGPGRGALQAALHRQGIAPAFMAEAGLLRFDADGGTAREMFFERVMFPIRDRAGRVISFGGRTLGEGQPKYLNGPETPTFAKRRTLYGLDLARAARAAEIVVVEGYMDVIALHQAGLAGALAPLGTALTEEHLDELWRLSPAPVLCFDADAAGRRAALRAAELALPMLAPDRTLAFVLLPEEGDDPDSYIQRKGGDAFRSLLKNAWPMADTLYALCREAGDKTPEQRARLRTRLRELAALIPDRPLSYEYRRAMETRFFDQHRRARAGAAAPATPTQARPAISDAATRLARAHVLTGALIRHPTLLPDVEDAYRTLDLPPDCTDIRGALLDWADQASVLDSRDLMNHLTKSGLGTETERLLATEAVRLAHFANADAMPDEAEAGWWHVFGLMNLPRLCAELAQAKSAAASSLNGATQRLLVALTRAREGILAADADDPARAASASGLD